MLLKRIYDDDLAQASYLVACQASGEALVVDPRRDVAVYLDEAARQGLRVVKVTETHIHADYLSGSAELAARTGATLYVSGEGGSDWQYDFGAVKLRDGDVFELGNLTVTALHTPGHTPEHLSFLLTDGATTDKPGFLFSGDFVFVGDVGRPDLLDEVAGGADTRREGARELFTSLQSKFLTLPDYVQVWPGHGAGSACGKALGAVASSTVGYERRFAWWAKFLASDDEAGFVRELLGGQPDAPRYFGRMKRQNRAGPALLGERSALEELSPDRLEPRHDLVLVDTRPREAFLAASVPGSLHVPAGGKFATYAAYVLDPEDERPVVVLAKDRAQAEALRAKLSRIGMDGVTGFVTSLEGLRLEPVPTLSPDDLKRLNDPFILDVRTTSEYQEGHLPGATQLHAGRVLAERARLPENIPIVLHCQSGARATVVGSALRAAGFDNVVELEGSYAAWAAQNGREDSG